MGRVVDSFATPPVVYLFGSEVRGGPAKLVTGGNCASSASPAACGNASAGSVAFPSSASTLVVNTGAVSSFSQIMLQEDTSLGARLGVTCSPSGKTFDVTDRTGATSFTISISSTFGSTACLNYLIVN